MQIKTILLSNFSSLRPTMSAHTVEDANLNVNNYFLWRNFYVARAPLFLAFAAAARRKDKGGENMNYDYRVVKGMFLMEISLSLPALSRCMEEFLIHFKRKRKGNCCKDKQNGGREIFVRLQIFNHFAL
jgi:hypothetical protein